MCLPAIMGNGRLMAKFPLRGCGQPSPHRHTQTYATATTQTCTCTHFLTQSFICPCVFTHRCPQNRGFLGWTPRGIDKLPFSVETWIWPDVVTQTVISPYYLVLHNQGKNGAGTYSRASYIMYGSGSIISTSAKMFPSIFQFKSCTVQSRDSLAQESYRIKMPRYNFINHNIYLLT